MMPMPDLNKLADAIHQENMKWWQDLETGEPIQTPMGQKEMLMISEVAEAMEGLRKGLADDKLPHRDMAEVEAADYVIRVLDFAAAHKIPVHEYTVPNPASVFETDAELLLSMCRNAEYLYRVMSVAEADRDMNTVSGHVSDCVASAQVFCDRFGYDLWAAVEEKRAFNRERPDHKPENRKQEGGKKW